MSNLPKCPKCSSEFTYEDGEMLICPECGHEWDKNAAADVDDVKVVVDSNGNVLKDGDMITVIKDVNIIGSSIVVKVGT